MASPASTRIDAVSRRVSPLLDRISRTIRLHPGALALATTFGLSLPWFVRNYRAYIALGPGGLPYNVVGWLMALTLKLFALDPIDTSVYDANPNKETFLEDPDSIPERRGTRPNSGFHILPARQQSKVPGKEMGVRLQYFADNLVKMNPTLVEWGPSPNERRNQGVLLAKGVQTPHQPAKGARREVFHMHPSDRSMHAVIAPQDAKLVIERNWGERHALSGSFVMGLPREFTWIYAPRNEEELEVVQKILVAAVGFMANSRDVKH